jgi:non-ribosomal peptide synthetase component F
VVLFAVASGRDGHQLTATDSGQTPGVLCHHRGLHNLARAQLELFGVTPHDHLAQVAPWSADASIFEIVLVLALAAGAALHPARPADRYPGPPLENFLNNARVSLAVLTPSVLRSLHPTMLGTVRVLISAGEDLLPELARSRLPGRRMFNAYGPTEATLWSTTRGLDPALLERVGATPLGDPIPGTQLRLLTDDLSEPTDGAPGELSGRDRGGRRLSR